LLAVTINSLLPPNSTPLESALEVAMRPDDDVLAAIELIRTAKEAAPDDWLYWLIWEFGLEELLPYLPEPRVALENGLRWQPIRGTPASIKMALGWLGLYPSIEEETPTGAHWFEFQLSLKNLLGDCVIPTDAELKNVVGLARLSAPVGTRLTRLHCGNTDGLTDGCDVRRFVLDQSDWGDLLSDYSGSYNPDLGLVVSFCHEVQLISDQYDGAVAHFNHLPLYGMHSRYEDRLIWDYGSFDEPVLRIHDAVISRTSGILGQGIGRNILVLDGSWILDGSNLLNGKRTNELPQYPLTHKSSEYETNTFGWGDEAQWDDRTWAGGE
jgi:P2-related tail formation protein